MNMMNIIIFQKRGFALKRNVLQMVPSPGAHFIGQFKNGQAVGTFWLGLINNGFIHGQVDAYGQISGNDLTFIYPDGKTALHGSFIKTIMKSTKYVNSKY